MESIGKREFFSYKMRTKLLKVMRPLKKYITSYYKGLFGKPMKNNFRLDESIREGIPQVTESENEVLTQPFTKEEVRCAIFQMEHNKSPGPVGFLAKFYQVFWELIKHDIMAFFHDFHKGQLPLYSLDFGTIVLLSKCQEATKIQQYRTICLLNVSFKICTKVATNRLMVVTQKVVNPTHTTFLLDMNIMEGVVILHETLYEMHQKKQNGVIFKIDFEKANDKVRWYFVKQT
jgi:hypothetical protein